MALRRTRPMQGLSGSATGGGAASQSSMTGHINFDRKQAGKPSAGNPHAGFDAAGAGNEATVGATRARKGKPWKQTSTRLRATVAVFDPTCEGLGLQCAGLLTPTSG